jgi:hypothetical protein
MGGQRLSRIGDADQTNMYQARARGKLQILMRRQA